MMSAAIKTDMSRLWNTGGTRTGGTSERAADKSFLDTFEQALKESGREENRSRKPETGAEASKDSAAAPDKTGFDKKGPDKTGTDKTDPEKKTAETPEDGEANRTDKKKADPTDQSLAMMMLQAEMPAADILVIPDAAGEVSAAETESGMLLAAVETDPGTGTASEQLVQMPVEGLSGQTSEAEAVLGSAAKDATGVFTEELLNHADGQELAVTQKTSRENGLAEKTSEKAAETGKEAGLSELLKDRSAYLKSMTRSSKEGTDAGNREDQSDAQPGLEDLKRSAQERGLDLTDRMTAAGFGGRFQVTAAGTESTAGTTPVMEQLQAGLEQAVKKDQQEFTVHLKPDGLGEIIIRLASEGGKVTVNIGVSNSETQKLITGQMMNLKEMLEPLHAEVGEVYHDSQAAMNFLEYGQQMPQQENRQPSRYYGKHRSGEPQENEEILAVSGQMMAQSGLSRLYAYI